MHRRNIEMLRIVAGGLNDLRDDFVFVGGAVAELYRTITNKNSLYQRVMNRSILFLNLLLCFVVLSCNLTFRPSSLINTYMFTIFVRLIR